MTIILARHGQTSSNRDALIMGQTDSPLTAEGVELAHALAHVIRPFGITAAYSSPLGRALASAHIYVSGLGIPVRIRPAMAELSCGLWEKRPRHEVKPEPGPLRDSWTERPPLGESCLDAEQRVAEFIRELKQVPPDDPVLVVGHAGVNRVFLKLWLELTPDYASTISHPHGKLFVV